MLTPKQIWFRKPLAIFFSVLIAQASSAIAKQPASSAATQQWTAVESRVKSEVYQLNVAIKVQFKDGTFAQLADLSPRRRYPVFITTKEDQGFRVMGHGTCFPVRAQKQDRTYLLTNKHVIDFGEGMVQECERFFAGMRKYAERSAGFGSPDQRYRDLTRIVNLGVKKNISETERAMYRATVDTIWDMYDDHLSAKVVRDGKTFIDESKRKEFDRCLAQVGMKSEIGYFVHKPGPLSQPPVVAQLYKQAHKENEPDLAVIIIPRSGSSLELEPAPASIGQPIRAVGYPSAAKPAKGAAPYAPSFHAGKVTRVSPWLVSFDAQVSRGDSGGPLVNQSGKVLGVVARRAMPDISTDRYAGAISVNAVKYFAPELFGKPPTMPRFQR